MSPDAPADGAEVVDFPRTRERTRRRPRLWRRRKRQALQDPQAARAARPVRPRRARRSSRALFGMFMAVASDLPHAADARRTRRPMMVDRSGNPIGTLTGNERRIYLSETQIAPVMKHAIISIEDRRFYTNSGVDLRGIARAAVEDVTSGQALQGASTIPQQFVKLSLAAENERTVFQKLREAALAYHLTRRWSKEEILRNYLNPIYFGNGAYGSSRPRGPTSPTTTTVRRRQDAAALRVGPAARTRPRCWPAMVASPSAFDPIQHPVAAKRRRDLVLCACSSRATSRARSTTTREGPGPADARRPDLPGGGHGLTRTSPPGSSSRSSTSSAAASRARSARSRAACRSRRRSTRGCSSAAEKAIKDWLAEPGGPRASLVAIDNEHGEVRAMVGGDNYGDARRSTSPPRASASPVPRSSRSCSPRRCASTSARSRPGNRRRRPTSSRAARSSRSTTTRTPTPA